MLKGEYKIELRDAKTGRLTDERVGHNFVTDFFAEQLKTTGGRQPLASYSLDNFFGGIMCFDSAINENTDMTGQYDHPFFAPASKSMVANGCITYSASSSEATELGAYNATDSVDNNGRMRRYVYDWDTQEGNGTIGAVCLTSVYGGWKGVGNRTSGGAITAQNNQVGYQYTDYNYSGNMIDFTPPFTYLYTKVCYVQGNRVGILYQTSDLSATSITVREYDLPQTLLNPFNIPGDYFDYARYDEKTYPLGNYYAERVGVGSNAGYWYVIRRANNNDRNVKVDIFNNDGTHEDYTITVPSSELSDARNLCGEYMTGLIKKNGYIFFCSGYDYQSGNNIFAWSYNIGTGAVTLLYSGQIENYFHWFRMYLIELEDVIYNDIFVIKFVSGVPTVYQRNRTIQWNALSSGSDLGKYIQDLNDPYDIWQVKPLTQQNNLFRQVGLPDIWLSTIANLSSPVTKTADKTMKITYTLTLEE